MADDEKEEVPIEKRSVKIGTVASVAVTVLLTFLGWVGVSIYNTSKIVAANTKAIDGITREADVHTRPEFARIEDKVAGVEKAMVELRLTMERNKLEQMKTTIETARILLENMKNRDTSRVSEPLPVYPPWTPKMLPVPLPEKDPKETDKVTEEMLEKYRRRMIEQRKHVESLNP